MPITTWSVLLDDPTKSLEWVVKVDGLDFNTDTPLEFYVLSPNSGRTDTPVAPEAASISSLGSIKESLSEDQQFSGVASLSIGAISLDNTPIPDEGEGPLDYWASYTFDGYPITLYLLEVGSAWSSPDPFRVCRQQGEPVFDGNEVSFELQSALSRLDRNVLTEKYLGIPTCLELLTNLGRADAVTNAAYTQKSYTIMARFRSSTIDATQIVIMRRGSVAVNRHFNLFIRNTAPIGVLDFQASFGGVSTTVARTAARVDDDVWHEVVCSVLDKGDAYMMLDGELVARITPAASVDIPGSPIEMGVGGAPDRRIMDIRFMAAYMSEIDALSIQSSPGTPDDPAIKGLWNFDDNTGAVATDYSATANHAAILTTVTTDYRWISSDMGTPQLAGQVVPWGLGYLFNAQAQLIHPSDGGGAATRYRYDENPVTLGTPVVKSRGVVLTLTTDYTEPVDGILRMVAAQSDPITIDINSVAQPYPSDLLEDVLVNRSGYESSELNFDAFDALTVIAPMISSYRADKDITGQQVSSAILGSVLGHMTETHEGKLSPGVLFPPGGGPHSSIYTLECVKGGGLVYGDIADQTGSFSIAAWVRSYRLSKDEISSASQDEIIVSKLSATTGYWLKLPINGIGRISFGFRAASVDTELLSNDVAITWHDLQFVVGVFDAAADIMTIYCGVEGGSLHEVATVGGKTAVPSGNAEPLTVGQNMAGVLAEVSVWSKALTLVEAQGIMDVTPTVPTANLSAFLQLNEGSGDAIEKVSSTTSALGANTRWQPELVYDLSQDVTSILSLRKVTPVRRVKVDYRMNYTPMAAADISSLVTAVNRWDLMRPNRSVTVFIRTIDSAHPNAKDIPLRSYVVETQDARRVGRLLMNRFSRTRQVGHVTNLDRRTLRLESGISQVYIYSPRYGLSAGAHFRVTMTDKRLDSLRGSLLLWR